MTAATSKPRRDDPSSDPNLLTLPAIWDLFVKWHIAFTTFNLTGLAFVGSGISGTSHSVPGGDSASPIGHEVMLACVFLSQNILAITAAILVGVHSYRVSSALKANAADGTGRPLHTAKMATVGTAALIGLHYLFFAAAWLLPIILR